MYEEILMKKAIEVGVNVKYDIYLEKFIGKCCVIIIGEDRFFVIDLGVVKLFDINFLNDFEIWSLVEKVKYFYIGGFILSVNKFVVLKIFRYVVDNDKVVIMNFYVIFLCFYFVDFELNILQYVDVFFGNGDEAKEFGKEVGFIIFDIKKIGFEIVYLFKVNSRYGRIVIFIQGRFLIIIVRRDEIQEILVVLVEKDLIKDINGCGDVFVGGFLLQFV